MKNALILIALVLVLSAARSLLPEGAAEMAGVARTELGFGFMLLAAFFVSRVLSRFGLPKLVGYILAGIAVGPAGLGLVPQKMTTELELVNGVAICLIALTAGGELNYQKVRSLLSTILALTGWAILGTATVLALTLYGLQSALPFLSGLNTLETVAVCAMLGIVLSAQSPAVVMALLSETRAEGTLSRTILGTVVFADLVVIVLFGVASAIAKAATGSAYGVGDTVFDIAFHIFGSIGAGVVVGALLTVYVRKVRQGVEPFVLLACVVVAELGTLVHLDPLVVMLVAGLVIANFSPREAPDLIRDLEAASLPVYIVFFALAGATLHLESVASLGAIALGLVLIRGGGFWIFGRVATGATRAPDIVRRWAWAGLLPQAGLALALALLIKQEFGAFGEAASALLIGVVAINELLMPILLKQVLLRSGEAKADPRTKPLGELGPASSRP